MRSLLECLEELELNEAELDVKLLGQQGRTLKVSINGKEYEYEAEDIDALNRSFSGILKHSHGRALAYLKKHSKLVGKEGQPLTEAEADHEWSAAVTKKSNAMTVEPGTFTLEDPKEMAEAIKRSVLASDRRKGSVLESGIDMFNFYVNRAGKNLSKERIDTIEKAKKIYRELVDSNK